LQSPDKIDRKDGFSGVNNRAHEYISDMLIRASPAPRPSKRFFLRATLEITPSSACIFREHPSAASSRGGPTSNFEQQIVLQQLSACRFAQLRDAANSPMSSRLASPFTTGVSPQRTFRSLAYLDEDARPSLVL